MIKYIIVSALSFLLLSTPALAVNSSAPGLQNKPSLVLVTSAPASHSGLSQAHLTVCQNREKAINRNMEQLTKMATNMLGVFNGISTRVEEFYTGTAVPAGVTVASYGDLTDKINSAKASVDTALSAATADAGSFTCDTQSPKAILQTFRTNMRAVKSALQTYRKAIVELITTVRTAYSSQSADTKTNEASPSPNK